MCQNLPSGIFFFVLKLVQFRLAFKASFLLHVLSFVVIVVVVFDDDYNDDDDDDDDVLPMMS